jgi:hypothetical protein
MTEAMNGWFDAQGRPGSLYHNTREVRLSRAICFGSRGNEGSTRLLYSLEARIAVPVRSFSTILMVPTHMSLSNVNLIAEGCQT